MPGERLAVRSTQLLNEVHNNSAVPLVIAGPDVDLIVGLVNRARLHEAVTQTISVCSGGPASPHGAKKSLGREVSKTCCAITEAIRGLKESSSDSRPAESDHGSHGERKGE
jgi:hypothetical protein